MLGLLALLPFLIYIPSLWNGFVHWDDGLLITENPWIQGLSWINVRHAFTSYDPELYIPLTFLTYQLNYAIAGLSPWIYHLTNLLLHIANVLLLYSVVLQLTTKKTAAFAAALLFAVHPLHTEAVAWAAERKDVLSTAFLFLTFALFLRYRTTGRRGWYTLAIGSFFLGLLAKVSILTAPLILIALDWTEERVSLKRSALDSLPFWGLSILFGIISLFGKLPQGSFLYDKLLIGARALTFLLQKLLFPWGLTVFYPYTQPISLMTPDIFFSVVVVIAMSGMCMWTTRWSRWPLFAWLFFLLLVIPSFPNMLKGRNLALDAYITTDHYAYAASFGPLLLAGLFFNWMQEQWRTWAWSGLAAITIIFSMLVYRQSLFWKDSETLFRHAIAVSPMSYVAHQNIGTILGKRGDLDGAMQEYAAALKIRPDAITYYNIGQIMEDRGRTEDAIAAYWAAVETSPVEVDAWKRLLVIGNTTEVRAALQTAAEENPDNPEVGALLQ